MADCGCECDKWCKDEPLRGYPSGVGVCDAQTLPRPRPSVHDVFFPGPRTPDPGPWTPGPGPRAEACPVRQPRRAAYWPPRSVRICPRISSGWVRASHRKRRIRQPCASSKRWRRSSASMERWTESTSEPYLPRPSNSMPMRASGSAICYDNHLKNRPGFDNVWQQT